MSAETRTLPCWEYFSNEDGDAMWVVVDEHSPAARYRALRIVERETGDSWLLLNARQTWVRDHELEPCGYKARERLTDEQRDTLDGWQWDGMNEMPAELEEAADSCWCFDSDGCGASVCDRGAEGAQPAYVLEWRDGR